MNSQIQEEIIKNINSLNIYQQTEVLDFIEFIKQKRQTKSYDFNLIDSIFGKYSNSTSSSDDFSKRKQIEKELEDNKWNNK